MTPRSDMRMGVLLLASMLAAPLMADWEGEVSLELREFFASPLDARQHGGNASISGELEYYHAWDQGRQSLTVTPFARLDQHDDERSHVDLREAVWIYSEDELEVRLGLDKVFWGATEVLHLVDIINQTDLLENPDGEQKLGQPMFKLSLEKAFGVLDLYLMPRFRERTAPGREGRLRTQPRIATEERKYENRRKFHYPDVAMRWSQILGDWDLGLSLFHGTGREPVLVPGLDDGEPVLIPRYVIINQASVDAQGALGDLLLKFEGLHRQGQGRDFWAATGGFEYTFVGILESSADLGVLAEFMWDDRGKNATTPFNEDVFLGLRWAANDADGSEVLTGIVTDLSTGSRFYNLEASRRIGNAWKVSLQARFWSQVDDTDVSHVFRDEDYAELQLTRYF